MGKLVRKIVLLRGHEYLLESYVKRSLEPARSALESTVGAVHGVLVLELHRHDARALPVDGGRHRHAGVRARQRRREPRRDGHAAPLGGDDGSRA